MDEPSIDNGAAPQPATTAPAPWHAAIAPSLSDAPDVATWLQSRPEKDLGSFAKSHYNLEKKLGTSLVPPGKNAPPEEHIAFRHKVLGGPGSADKYSFAKMSELLGDDAIDKDLLNEYRNVLNEYGIPQAALDKLTELRGKEYSKAKSLIEHDSAAEKAKFAEWAQTKGLKNAEQVAAQMMLKRAEAAGANKEQLQTILNVTGLGDAAWLMQAFAELGMATGESSSMMDSQPVGGNASQGAAAQNEYNDIMHNKQNPKYELFWKGDKATVEYVHSLGNKAHPGETTL
jgi:hypothetical protein